MVRIDNIGLHAGETKDSSRYVLKYNLFIKMGSPNEYFSSAYNIQKAGNHRRVLESFQQMKDNNCNCPCKYKC